MKKIFKIIGIVTLVIVALILVFLVVISFMAKEKNDQYYKYSNPRMPIESRYASMGELEVLSKEYDINDDLMKKIIIWYPADIETSSLKYPIVLWANGTGSKSETYKAFFKHLASWGFIVVGNDDENTRTGDSLNRTIDFLIKENEVSNSIFYNKLDLNNIGLGGHSQGGPAVFNMSGKQNNKEKIKVVYAVSPTSSYHTNIFKSGWEYNMSLINVPTFMTAGTGSFDAGTATSANQKSDEKSGVLQGIAPLWSLEENYNLLSDNIDKAYARKIGVDHGDSYLQFDGYMTAWFRYYLMNDKAAEKAFFGENPEIMKNPNYQDVKINIRKFNN